MTCATRCWDSPRDSEQLLYRSVTPCVDASCILSTHEVVIWCDKPEYEIDGAVREIKEDAARSVRMSERAASSLCAVQRHRSSAGAIPARQLSLQPVAIGAVVEVTILPKPLMERVA